MFPAWLFFGLPMFALGGDLFIPPAHDDGYASTNLFLWMWYKYLSFDQQLVLMFFILSGVNQ